MTSFTRARSPEAKQEREKSILDAARILAERDGVRTVTLTDIATAVGLHKSAMLRYFETRELILLRLAEQEWATWSSAVQHALADLPQGVAPHRVAAVLARTLTAQPLFCDLLAHVPLHLERHVSVEAVRSFKLAGAAARRPVEQRLRGLLGLSPRQAGDVVATAVSLAGAFWQTANPGPVLAELYRSDPGLSHAVVDLEPRLARILDGLLQGWRKVPATSATSN